jgi:ParB family transcriptional regulator, chromosome partitioning protein
MEVSVTRAAKGVTVRLEAIEIPSTTRPYNATAVVELKKSIAAIGLQSAPTVVERDGRYLLVAGRHRLEALKLLGVETVLCRLVDLDDREARMWTISENLHRAELNVLQRAEQISEFVQLAEEKRAADQSAQVGPIESKRADGRGHRPESGDRLAARELGMTRQEVQRTKAIAALPRETKDAAEDLDLDDNQAALLAAARAEEPDEQIEVLETIAARGKVSATRDPDARPLRNLVNLSAGKFCRWILLTTPNDQTHVLRMLEEATAIFRDILEGKIKL